MNLEAMLNKVNALKAEAAALKTYHTPIIAHMPNGSTLEVDINEAIEMAMNQTCSRLEFLDRSGQGLLPELLNGLL